MCNRLSFEEEPKIIHVRGAIISSRFPLGIQMPILYLRAAHIKSKLLQLEHLGQSLCRMRRRFGFDLPYQGIFDVSTYWSALLITLGIAHS